MLTLETLPRPLSQKPVSEFDNALQRRVKSMLRQSGYRSVARLECRVHQGIVELAGVVPSFYLKQVAQVIVQRLEPIEGIRNDVQVV